MKLNQEELDNGVLKLTPVGSMDVQGAVFLGPTFEVLPKQSERIIVDLSGVDFLASIGVRVLVRLARGMAERGGHVSVYSPQDSPRAVILSTGVDKLVALSDDEASAIAAVSASG